MGGPRGGSANGNSIRATVCAVCGCVWGICEHPRTDWIFRSTKPNDERRREGGESMGIYWPKPRGGYYQRPDPYVSRIPTTSTGLNHPPYPTSAGLCQWPINVHDSRSYAIRKAQTRWPLIALEGGSTAALPNQCSGLQSMFITSRAYRS